MLEFVKKYGVIAIIAVLFAFFSFSIVDLVMEEPQYSRYCEPIAKPIVAPNRNCTMEAPPEFMRDCETQGGYVEFQYDSSGCAVSYICNTCYAKDEAARKQHRMIGFIVTSIMGLIAIIIGLYVRSKEDVVEWVISGLLIGGLITVFAGTVSYFGDMDRFARPVVLLLEIALIIFVAVKTSRRK